MTAAWTRLIEHAQRTHKAYLVGGGIGSLAAAAFLIRDAGFPSLDAATELYQQLRTHVEADGVRLTARITAEIAKARLKRARQQAEQIELCPGAWQLITAQCPLAEVRAERPRSVVPRDRPAAAPVDPACRISQDIAER